MNGFKNVERISYTADILQYWKTQQLTDPELYQLANIVLAVPATQAYMIIYVLPYDNIYFVIIFELRQVELLHFQVSVERSFSGLKFVVSDLRTSLDPELLEAMKILNYVIK